MYFERQLQPGIIKPVLKISCIIFTLIITSCSGDPLVPEAGTLKNLIIESEIDHEKKQHLISEFDQYIKIIRRGERIGSLAPWVTLMEASLLFLKEEKVSAIQVLDKIPENSPAFLDASLFKINAELQNPQASSSFDRELVLLEAQIKKTRQEVLTPELLLAKATSHKKRNDYHGAIHLYYNIRNQYPDTFFSQIAKQEISNLTRGIDAPLPIRSFADMLEEARILIDENDFQRAYVQLREAKNSIHKDTPAYYEIQLEEVSLLLASNRSKEARVILSYLASHASPLISARAVLTLSRLLVQEGSYELAESLLIKNKTKIMHTPIKEDFLTLLVEINIRRNALKEATDAAKIALDKQLSLKNELKILKQLAWIYFRKNDLKTGNSYFTLLLERTTDVLQLTADNENPRVILEEYFPYTERNTIKRRLHRNEHQIFHRVIEEVRNLRAHALYWSAVLNIQSGKQTLGLDKLQSLVLSAPVSYYRMLAEKTLSELPTEKEIILPESFSCPLKKRQNNINSSLKSLIRSGLHEEAKRQILWDISNDEKNSGSSVYMSDLLIPLQISLIMKEARLSNQSLEYLAKELPPWKFELLLQKKDQPVCINEYLSVYFQVISSTEAKKITTSHKLPLPLTQSMVHHHFVDNTSFPEISDSIKTQQHDSDNPHKMLLSLYTDSHEIHEYQHLKERYPDFSDDMILELLSDTENRERIKDIVTGMKYLSQ